MKNTRVGQILHRLMNEKKIRVAELARRVNLPQPTVHRIANGLSDHPHISSLEPIARFFSISIEQLQGLEPIPWLDRLTKVPLLSWDSLSNWPNIQSEIEKCELVLTDAVVGKAGYAVRINDASMDPD